MFISKWKMEVLENYGKSIENIMKMIDIIVERVKKLESKISILEQKISEKEEKPSEILFILDPNEFDIVIREIMKDIFLS